MVLKNFYAILKKHSNMHIFSLSNIFKQIKWTNNNKTNIYIYIVKIWHFAENHVVYDGRSSSDN